MKANEMMFSGAVLSTILDVLDVVYCSTIGQFNYLGVVYCSTIGQFNYLGVVYCSIIGQFNYLGVISVLGH